MGKALAIQGEELPEGVRCIPENPRMLSGQLVWFTQQQTRETCQSTGKKARSDAQAVPRGGRVGERETDRKRDRDREREERREAHTQREREEHTLGGGTQTHTH